MFPPSLQMIFITGKYIAILIFDGSVCVLVLSCYFSCYIIQLFHVSLGWCILCFFGWVFNEVFLFCFYAVRDCSVCLCVLFLCCCFCCSRSAVVNCTFLFLPHLHFVDSVCRNPVFLLIFLLSQNFAACSGPHLLDLLPLCVYLVGLRICFSL